MADRLARLRGPASLLGMVMLLLGALGLILGLTGGAFSAWLFGILGVITAGGGACSLWARQADSTGKAGVRLVSAGWSALSTGLGGVLIAPSSVYRLGNGLQIVLMLVLLATAAVGLYTLIWGSRETGVHMAP